MFCGTINTPNFSCSFPNRIPKRKQQKEITPQWLNLSLLCSQINHSFSCHSSSSSWVSICSQWGEPGIITLIWLSSYLHTPIYYFLSRLSFIDLCHSTITIPKMLVNFVTEKNIISYPEWMSQIYFFLIFAISEYHILATMAICNPLIFNVIMDYQVCSWMRVGV
jgi:hypothetical protein